MKPEFQEYKGMGECCRNLAEFIVKYARTTVLERDLFSFVLTGGKTVRPLYESLAGPPFADDLPWQQTHFFWGDERYLPTDHPDSNKGMAARFMLDKVKVPASNIHPIPTDPPSPKAEAQAYDKKLHGLFSPHGVFAASSPDCIKNGPCFDLVLLGMGTDGHIASLFPGTATLEEKKQWVTSVSYPYASPPVDRITLTLPIINRARTILFLISGAEKLAIVRTISADPVNAGRNFPAARVSPLGRLIWFMSKT
ncbi:MAG: 6-phosphogluconolactonase [Desulfobulbaceae bacterium]|nr:6-phosphogluconolactonase [Desulfobulbaceae bacterium]